MAAPPHAAGAGSGYAVRHSRTQGRAHDCRLYRRRGALAAATCAARSRSDDPRRTRRASRARMKPIPAIPRILLGPGPSLVSPRVMRALATPVLGHLDPQLLSTMDDVRDALRRIFRAPDGSTALAVSGTGTAAMETCLANLVEPGSRMVVVTNGYFGERLAEIGQRFGAQVHRGAGEWGRAIDPTAVANAIMSNSPQLVAVVHAETSTGVVNPVEAIAAA